MAENHRKLLLAANRDYNTIARVLRCKRSETGLRCSVHGGEWYFDRCLMANTIALRLGSSVRQMTQRITELESRLAALENPPPSEPVGSYESGVDAGLQEALRVIGHAGRGRADFRLRRYIDRVRQRDMRLP